MELITRAEMDRKPQEEKFAYVQEVVEAAGLTSYDWAYPHPWWKQFKADTGFDHCNGEIVWGYGKGFVFGQPVALTPRAKEALEKVAA